MTDWFLPIVFSASGTLLNLLPYVVAGVVVSELLKFVEWSKVLTRYARMAPRWSILWAVGIGMASPMCTYGSLPIVLTLYGLGFPIAALGTFLIASSLMNPQLLIITWGGISPELALWRVLSVALFALIFGFLMDGIESARLTNPSLNHQHRSKAKHKRVFTWPSFVRGSFQSLQFIGFYIMLGVLSGAIVDVVLPKDWLSTTIGEPEWLGILVGALMGIPFYACGGGTIPLIDAMLDKGMSVGAALAFFIVGPATRITPLVALAAIIRTRVIVLFVVLVLLYAVGIGFLVDQF